MAKKEKKNFFDKIIEKFKAKDFKVGDIVMAPDGSVCKVMIVRNDQFSGACVKPKIEEENPRSPGFRWYRLKDLEHCDGKITKNVLPDIGDTVVDKSGFHGMITKIKPESNLYYISYEVVDNEKVADDRWL